MLGIRPWLPRSYRGGVVLALIFVALMRPRVDAHPAAVGSPRVEPTVTRVIPVKYRDAVELAAILRPHLGACAVVTADPHTNALIITGAPSCLLFQHERNLSRTDDRSPSERQPE
jgi:type II secretory pathway component GspD/PulD (secretin)